MTRNGAWLALIGGLAFVIGMITYLPASLAIQWAIGDTPVRMEGVSGTLLNGQAAYVSLPEGGLDNIRWDMHPSALLIGRAAADIRADTDLGGLSANIARGLLGGNTLTDVTGDATVGWVSKLAGLTFVPLSGRLSLDLQRVSFDDALNVDTLTGRIQLTNSRWELLNPALSLGRFSADLSPIDDGIQADLSDGDGPLALTGQIQLIDQTRYRLNVRLRPRAGADDRLKDALSQLGRPDEQGWYRVREQGRL